MTRTEHDALEEALRPRSCRRCGRTFGNGAAYAVHFESGENSPCLPGDAYGQLVQVDGVWCAPGAAGR
jgi:hypothetical protein